MAHSSISVTCPEAIRTVNRREKLEHIWDSDIWETKKAAWSIGKVCLMCGSSQSIVPHHDNVSLYREKTDYLDLSKCIPLCNTCHRNYHAGRVLCQVCNDTYIKPEYDCCWNCLPTDKKISISSSAWEKKQKQKQLRKDYEIKVKGRATA
jgi:hypothetical protein